MVKLWEQYEETGVGPQKSPLLAFSFCEKYLSPSEKGG